MLHHRPNVIPPPAGSGAARAGKARVRLLSKLEPAEVKPFHQPWLLPLILVH